MAIKTTGYFMKTYSPRSTPSDRYKRKGEFRNCLRIRAGGTGSYPGVAKAVTANNQAENLIILFDTKGTGLG